MIIQTIIALTAGFIGSVGYGYFKELLSKHIIDSHALRIVSLLICIVLGVAIVYILKWGLSGVVG